MRVIRPASWNDYIFLFGDYRSLYSDLIVKKSFLNGNFFIMFDDFNPLGYICSVHDNSICCLSHAFTIPTYRHQGVFSQLVNHVINSYNLNSFLISFSDNDELKNQLINHVKNLGFIKKLSCKTFRVNWNDLCSWRNNFWIPMMNNKGYRYVDILKSQGFKVCSFSDASSDLINQLKLSEHNSFQNSMEIDNYFADGNPCNRNDDLSCLAYKNDKLVAYYLVTSPDSKSVISEQSAVAKDYLNSGVIFLCVNHFVEAIGNRQPSNFAFCVYDDRPVAINYNLKFTKNLNFSSITIHKFLLNKS